MGRSSIPGRVKNFLFSTSSRLTQPPFQWVPGVKRPGREADHSSQTSAKVKKMWICTSHIRLHGVLLNYLNTGTTYLYLFYHSSFLLHHSNDNITSQWMIYSQSVDKSYRKLGQLNVFLFGNVVMCTEGGRVSVNWTALAQVSYMAV
jgi:hypothetical protein